MGNPRLHTYVDPLPFTYSTMAPFGFKTHRVWGILGEVTAYYGSAGSSRRENGLPMRSAGVWCSVPGAVQLRCA